MTSDTGIGDPSLATAEKGQRFAAAVAEKYATLLQELAAISSTEDLYVKP